MRKCPYCARDIQDEAVVCRHCKLDIQQADYLAGKARCPHCAEWIAESAQLCPHCGRNPMKPPVVQRPAREEGKMPPVPEWLRRLETATLKDQEGTEAAVEPGETGPLGQPGGISAPVAADAYPESKAPPFSGKKLPPPFAPETAPPEELGGEDWVADDESRILAQRLMDARGRPRQDVDQPAPGGAAGARPAAISPPLEDPRYRSARFERARGGTASKEPLRGLMRVAGRVAAVALTIVAVAALVFVLRPYIFGPDGLFPQPAKPSPSPVPQISPFPTARPSEISSPTPRMLPTEVKPTALSTAQTPASPLAGCIPWDQVKLDNEGKQLCAYGPIKRWFATSNLPFVAIFSEAEGTFMVIDRVQPYDYAQAGVCIIARGTVEVMGGVRPVIDTQGSLEMCP